MTKRDVSNAFYFFNNCLNGKLHPKYTFKKTSPPSKGTYRSCIKCGRMTKNITKICSNCLRDKIELENERELEFRRVRAHEIAEEYTHLLKQCSKKGTCDVLAAHHHMMEDDPDRLTTSFLVSLICNKTYTNGSKTRDVVVGPGTRRKNNSTGTR